MKLEFRKIAVVGLMFVFGCRMPSMQQFFANPTPKTPDAAAVVSGRDGRMNPELTSRNRDADTRPLLSRIFGSGKSADNGTVADNLRRANVASRQKRWKDAKRLYQAVLQRRPKNVVAHHELAKIADLNGDYRTAEKHYIAALHETPRDPNLYSDLGYSYFLQERYTESEQVLNRALRFDRNHARALNNLGWLYGTRGDYDTAYEYFRKAGTESQARSLISRLFPDGRPGTNTRNVSRWKRPRNPRTLRAPRPGGEFPDRSPSNVPSLADNERPELNPDMMKVREQMAAAHQQGVLQRQRRQHAWQSREANTLRNPNVDRRAYDASLQGGKEDGVSRQFRAYQPDNSGLSQERRSPAAQNRPQIRRRNRAVVPAHMMGDALKKIDQTSGRRIPRQSDNVGHNGSFDRKPSSRRDYREFPRDRTLGETQPSPFRDEQRTFRPINSARTANPEPTLLWPREQSRSTAEPAKFRNRSPEVERTDSHTRTAYQSSASDDRRFATYRSRPLPSVNREALKLGHNAGAGGNMFPLISQQDSTKSNKGNFRKSNGPRRLASSRNEEQDPARRFVSPPRNTASQNTASRNPASRNFVSRNTASQNATSRNDRAAFPLSGRDRIASDRGYPHDTRAETSGYRNGNSIRRESRDRNIDHYGRNGGIGMQTPGPTNGGYDSTGQPSSWNPNRNNAAVRNNNRRW